MQIDFHFATTYVVARIAGFNQHDAEIIAYSSQYVDDSTTSGFLRFDNGMRYYREATAHPLLDLDNLDNDESTKSWLPFHFLPGNELQMDKAPKDATFIQRLICRPNSPIAQAMMKRVIEVKDRPHALHRLVIASHVFVDTFAHQGFVGQKLELNNAAEIKDHESNHLPAMPLPPIGHGIVSTYPDRPFLKWSYTDSDGKHIIRDNPIDFTTAADELCKHYQRYLIGDFEADVPGLQERKASIFNTLIENTATSEETRLNEWIKLISSNHFGFGEEKIHYIGKGLNSWKHEALGDQYLDWLNKAEANATNHPEKFNLLDRIGATLSHGVHTFEAHTTKMPDLEQVEYKFNPAFLTSNYKLFHDAAADQRHDLTTKIFPKFGIYAG